MDLEARILGSTKDNYCSSSEEEDVEADGDGDVDNGNDNVTQQTCNVGNEVPQPPSVTTRGCYSQNTGPKGVLRDWQLYQEHKEQHRLAEEAKLVQMLKDKAITCAPSEAKSSDNIEDDLMSENTLQEFIQKRMEAMANANIAVLEKGGLIELNTADEYLSVTDDQNSKIPVLIHIYEQRVPECVKLNEYLAHLSESYRNVKFCKIRASTAGLSQRFILDGVPAILVYKGGQVIGNFVKLKEEFGSDFYESDVENFLLENGMLGSCGYPATSSSTSIHGTKS